VLGRVGKLSDERGYVGTWAGNAEAGGVAGTAAHVVVNFQPDEQGLDPVQVNQLGGDDGTADTSNEQVLGGVGGRCR
jgi:hypothetical protein